MKALGDQNADRALERDKIEKDFEAKLLKIVSDTESKMAAVSERSSSNFNAHIGAQLKELGTGVTTLLHAMENSGGADAPQEAAAPPANDDAAAGATPAPHGASQEAMPPPEAQRRLMPGRITTFKNGGRWTMKDGNPHKVS